MRTPRPPPRGFTLIELAVTLGIIVILTSLAYAAMRRTRPRATFDGVTAELHSAVHSARLQALASGASVAVLVFPDYRDATSQGRIVVLQDAQPPATSFFKSAAALNLDNYDPSTPTAPLAAAGAPATDAGQVVTTIDLPQGVNVGPPGGLGVASVTFPYNSITTSVACSFCATGGDHRGAIVFDPRGRATFYSASDTPSGDANGASFSIYGHDVGATNVDSLSTLVITRVTGALRTFHHG